MQYNWNRFQVVLECAFKLKMRSLASGNYVAVFRWVRSRMIFILVCVSFLNTHILNLEVEGEDIVSREQANNRESLAIHQQWIIHDEPIVRNSAVGDLLKSCWTWLLMHLKTTILMLFLARNVAAKNLWLWPSKCVPSCSCHERRQQWNRWRWVFYNCTGTFDQSRKLKTFSAFASGIEQATSSMTPCTVTAGTAMAKRPDHLSALNQVWLQSSKKLFWINLSTNLLEP